MSNWKSIVLLLALVPAGFAGVWKLQHAIDTQRAAMHQEQDDLALRSGQMLKLMSLEYAQLMADIYWTRVVQYYGDKNERRHANVDLLWPLLDITTTLDPHLVVAYRFGATFLSEPPPRGAGRPDQGVELLERGIQANPAEWQLNGDLGFTYYFNLKDYPKAAEAFLEGSKKPEAMIWMKVMAARIAAEGASLSTSIFLWNEVYTTTKDPQIKKNAERHLRLLKVEQDCKQLDQLSDEYEKRFGRRPTRTNELVQAGFLHNLPVDPVGYPYVFGEGGKAELNLDSPLLEEQVMSPDIK
jgi:hypothetical protein